jgi:hypothetical protein
LRRFAHLEAILPTRGAALLKRMFHFILIEQNAVTGGAALCERIFIFQL